MTSILALFIKLKFLNLGSKVCGLDKIDGKITHKKYQFIKEDITNKTGVKKKIASLIKKNKNIDVIINTASVSIFTKYDKRTNLELKPGRNNVLIQVNS